jgi:hypothetical protein
MRRAWMWRSVLGTIATITILAVAPPPAGATFPGINGSIAYRTAGNKIFLTGSGQLTSQPVTSIPFMSSIRTVPICTQ